MIFVVPLAFLPRRPSLLPVLAFLAVVVAGAATLAAPGQPVGSHTGAFSALTQAAAVTAVLALAVSLLPEDWGRHRRRHRTAPTPEAAAQ